MESGGQELGEFRGVWGGVAGAVVGASVVEKSWAYPQCPHRRFSEASGGRYRVGVGG